MPHPVEAPMAPFFTRLVTWQRQHGRHNLPWQGTRDPYRVWLSEIMLQQTQVATVKGYFSRFVAQFPDVASLAAANEDAVLGLWSGLGYYSRARNLHACAQAIVARHGGAFPSDAAALAELPGIGRSTAAAIASVCFSQRVSILDANVRRVLSRYGAVQDDLSLASGMQNLWQFADRMLPTSAADMPAYTQGLMDLGAMVCTPRKPRCEACPVVADCQARAGGNPEQFPVRTRKLRRSSVSLWVLQCMDADGAVLLCKRPAKGIWAGLYCLPVFDAEQAVLDAVDAIFPNDPSCIANLDALPVFTHTLTHKDLFIHTMRLTLARAAPAPGTVADPVNTPLQWVGAEAWPVLGLPAPIRRLLERSTAP